MGRSQDAEKESKHDSSTPWLRSKNKPAHFEDGIACKYWPFPSRHRTGILRTVLIRLGTPNAASLAVFYLLVFFCVGCGNHYTALAPGNPMPELVVAGWANDRDPGDLSGKVIVLEAFATW